MNLIKITNIFITELKNLAGIFIYSTAKRSFEFTKYSLNIT